VPRLLSTTPGRAYAGLNPFAAASARRDGARADGRSGGSRWVVGDAAAGAPSAPGSLQRQRAHRAAHRPAQTETIQGYVTTSCLPHSNPSTNPSKGSDDLLPPRLNRMRVHARVIAHDKYGTGLIVRGASVAGEVMHRLPQPKRSAATDGLMIRKTEGLLHRSCRQPSHCVSRFAAACRRRRALLQKTETVAGAQSPAWTAAADAVRRVRGDELCVHSRAGSSDADPGMRRCRVGARAAVDKAPAVANQPTKRRRAATEDVLEPEAVEELQVRAAWSLLQYRVQPSARRDAPSYSCKAALAWVDDTPTRLGCLQTVMRTLMAGGKKAMEPSDPQEALRGTPELAVVLNFLHTFRAHLQLTGFTAVRHGHHSAAPPPPLERARASAWTVSDREARTASSVWSRLPQHSAAHPPVPHRRRAAMCWMKCHS
jgi:hypothetical protein